MNIPDQPIAMSHRIHTRTEFWRQIHDDLWIQHPEWVEPNGESSKCDSYNARLTERLFRLGITYLGGWALVVTRGK